MDVRTRTARSDAFDVPDPFDRRTVFSPTVHRATPTVLQIIDWIDTFIVAEIPGPQDGACVEPSWTQADAS